MRIYVGYTIHVLILVQQNLSRNRWKLRITIYNYKHNHEVAHLLDSLIKIITVKSYYMYRIQELHCSIPGIPSLCVARRLKRFLTSQCPCRDRLGMLRTPSCPWHWVPCSRSKSGNWTVVLSLYSWNIAELDVNSLPTNQFNNNAENCYFRVLKPQKCVPTNTYKDIHNNICEFNVLVTYLSSPFNPLSIASGRSDLSKSCVMMGEPRHSVDRRLMTVDILVLALLSEALPGVLAVEMLGPGSPACWSRWSSSSINPCSAKGAGSTPRRVKRSAREAKHLRAPSDTWVWRLCYRLF